MIEGIIKCTECRTPIATGHMEAGELTLKCKRCGEKSLLTPNGVKAVEKPKAA